MSFRPFRTLTALAALLPAAAPGLARADASDVFYERSVMRAADARCALFEPGVSAALGAGAAQARGAALRSGVSPESLRASERAAIGAAAGAECAGRDLSLAAARVRSAYAAYAKMTRIAYPGEVAGWSADRNITRESRWRLIQSASFGADRLDFGLAGRQPPGVLLAVGRFADGATPYAARLSMRDAARAPRAYLDRAGAGKGPLPLPRRLPPRGALRTYGAEARSPAGEDLTPKGAKAGWAFRFPAAAAQELSTLDPRESVLVEFQFPDGARQAYVEVGDFAAGRAFLQVPDR